MRRIASFRIASFLAVLVIVVIMAAAMPTQANEWAGSITLLYEWPETPNRVQVWALDYPWRNDLYFTVLLEQNPRRGDAFDVSATYYVPLIKGVYATAGYRVRMGSVGESFPYVAITYRFAREARP